jgi:hypothetical protein
VRGEGGEGAPHSAFGGGVETAGGFVEEEDGGLPMRAMARESLRLVPPES